MYRYWYICKYICMYIYIYIYICTYVNHHPPLVLKVVAAVAVRAETAAQYNMYVYIYSYIGLTPIP